MVDTSSTTPNTPDAEYYFSLVVFKVDNTIFRVPRHGFETPGTIFEAMFSLPLEADNIQGSSDTNPIILPVREDYFRGFLRALYPFNGRQITEADWLGTLDLSTMWMFHDMRRTAIQALDGSIRNKPAKEAFLLAKKYRVASWLKDAYSRFLRQETLTASALSAPPFSLDWETIARVLSARLAALDTSLETHLTERCDCACCSQNSTQGHFDNTGFYHAHCACYKTVTAPTNNDWDSAMGNEFGDEIERMADETPSTDVPLPEQCASGQNTPIEDYP